MDEQALITLFEARDEAAIEETETAYGNALRRLASRFLHSEEAAEECVNDTFLKAWNAIPPAKPANLRGYLYQICRRTALARLEHDAAQKRTATVVSLTEELATCLPDPTAEQAYDAETLGELLNRFVGTLSVEHRRIFLRRYWYGDSVEDIAKQLHCGQAKIKTSLHRSRQKLRTLLESEGFTV